MPTVYLVSGASRGIGYQVVAALATRPDVVIYAGARDPRVAEQLNIFAREHANVHVIKLESTSVEDAQAAAREIKSRHGKVDVVLANAGMSLGLAPIRTETLDRLRAHFEVNTLGPVILYQAVRDLMPAGALFAVTSSDVGQISRDFGFPAVSYGMSKAALNYILTRIGYEDKEIVALALHPGLVKTDLGIRAAEAFGMTVDELPGAISPEESGLAVIKLLDTAHESKVSGKFLRYTGEEMEW